MSTISGFPAMTYREFTAIPDGTRVENFGWDQCVALANLYWVSVLQLPLPQGFGIANEWWSRRHEKAEISSNTRFTSTPEPGALVVWKTFLGNGAGHIGVVLSVNGDGSFNTLEQNWSASTRYTWRHVKYNDGGVEGFLVPLSNPASEPDLQPHQRLVAAQVRRRAEPNTSSTVGEPSLYPGDVGNFVGYTHGENVSGNDVWFQGISGWWFHSSGFGGGANTAGLPLIDRAVTIPKPETPRPDVPPTAGPALVTPGEFPTWIAFDIQPDPDHAENRNQELANYYGRPYQPKESHAHWWDDPAKNPTHDGVITHLKRSENLSVNFVLSARRVTQMVPLDQNALTTGHVNPDAWKVEIDPNLDEEGYKTAGYLWYAVEQANPHLAGTPIRLHKEFAATSCSDLDPAKIRAYAEQFRTGALDPATGEPPAAMGDIEAKIDQIIDMLTPVTNLANRILGGAA